jgi:hypothetical protein
MHRPINVEHTTGLIIKTTFYSYSISVFSYFITINDNHLANRVVMEWQYVCSKVYN